MQYNDKQIGRNIKAIRNANKKSCLDFADEIGISDSLLEKIENGTRHATDEIIQIISSNTCFSFSDIKYKNLSYLEKGEMHFDEDVSLGEFVETSEFSSMFSDILKLLFPLAEDEDALNNEEFSKGIAIAHKRIQPCNYSSADCIKAINHFIHASKIQLCADYSAINILSCFGYLYVAITQRVASEEDIETLLKKKISSISDLFFAIKTSINQNDIHKSKRLYLEKYNVFLTTYMRNLVMSERNSNFAYYYLCIRYLLGIMDENITLLDENQMRVFGESMFDSLWKMGNKYAKALHDCMES